MAKKKEEAFASKEEMVEETVKVVKQAVNVLELLLGADTGKIALPTKDVEITRLTEVFEAPFVVTCKALTPEKYEEVQDMALVIKGKEVDVDYNLIQILAVIEGVVDPTGKPLLKNKELMAKFKASTPKELCNTLFLSGEIANLYEEISNLTGFGGNAVKEVKN